MEEFHRTVLIIDVRIIMFGKLIRSLSAYCCLIRWKDILLAFTLLLSSMLFLWQRGSVGMDGRTSTSGKPVVVLKFLDFHWFCTLSCRSFMCIFMHCLWLAVPAKISFNLVVISKNFNQGALGTTTSIFWVWPSYNYAHIFKDGNMI